MKKLLWLFIIATTINTQAQHTIKGVVTDAKSNKKLAGVNILIPKIDKGTVSDIDGNFTIKNIAKSEVEIRFTYVGYKDIVKIVKFNQNEKVLQIQMHENVFEMDEVIISTAFNKLQKDNVMKVSHKSVAAMERSGVQNLMDGISQVAGVSKLSTGAGISKPVIR
jgi:iron complex outermembrane receptor protein